MAQPIRAVERALDVLLCFSAQTPELTMTQIAEKVGVHKSTAHRLLATLERKRFVQRDPDKGTYRLGIRALQMAYLTLEHNDLRRLATPFLSRLREQCQETIDLAVRDGTDIVFVHVLESPQRVKLAAAVGQRLPAFATASGKAMLAYMAEEAVQRLLKPGVPRCTEHTIASPEALLSDLRRTRELGFALSVQEYEAGINAVAAPILNPQGDPIAAVAVAGPAYRLTRERMIELGPVVAAAATEIAQEVRLAAHHQVEADREPAPDAICAT